MLHDSFAPIAENLSFGPSYATLVKYGAKSTPMMLDQNQVWRFVSFFLFSFSSSFAFRFFSFLFFSFLFFSSLMFFCCPVCVWCLMPFIRFFSSTFLYSGLLHAVCNMVVQFR